MGSVAVAPRGDAIVGIPEAALAPRLVCVGMMVVCAKRPTCHRRGNVGGRLTLWPGPVRP